MTESVQPQVGDTWYRYEERRFGHADDWGRVISTYIQLQVREFTVAKVTPKGVWLGDALGRWGAGPRFVLMSANKRYALPTQEAALESFMARKAQQMRILGKQLEHAESAHALAKIELAKLKPDAAPPTTLDYLIANR